MLGQSGTLFSSFMLTPAREAADCECLPKWSLLYVFAVS